MSPFFTPCPAGVSEWDMRLGIEVLLVPVWTLSILAAEGSINSATRKCIQRLRLPVYPGIAVSARISGDVTANISLGHAGAIERVAFAGKPHSLLANSVLDALKISMYASACADRDVTLVFRFVIEGKGHGLPYTAGDLVRISEHVLDSFPPRSVQP